MSRNFSWFLLFCIIICQYGFTPFLTATKEKMIHEKNFRNLSKKESIDIEIRQINSSNGQNLPKSDRNVRSKPPRDPEVVKKMKELIADKAREAGLAPEILLAVAQKESAIWPWTLNFDGQSLFFASKAEVLEYLKSHKITWRHSFDVGVMQVNSQWGAKFNWDINKMLDMVLNVEFACWYFVKNFSQYGMTWRGISKYHTPTEGERARNYAKDVVKYMNQMVVQN